MTEGCSWPGIAGHKVLSLLLTHFLRLHGTAAQGGLMVATGLAASFIPYAATTVTAVATVATGGYVFMQGLWASLV